MKTEYRNENLKLITEQQFGQWNFGGYRDFLENDKLKIRERYIGNHLFEIRYYKNSNENDSQIIEKFINTPGLKRFDIRERESYGDFWIDRIKYYDLAENQFYSFQVRELYNNKGQSIASERINPSLSPTDEDYRELVKYYYNSDNGFDGEYFVSHFENGVFEDIEHFQFGFDTDSQDVERGYYGDSAEQLMIRMGIPPKMRVWYVNNEFLPEIDNSSNPSQYQRNYEENVGVSKYESTTNKLYEDYFVEDRSVGIKNLVDNFMSSLNAISKDDTSAYTKIKSLVETSAKSLWDTSVSFVKSTMPDDRPLYWARIKMQVALKKHPYFLGQFTGSEINSGSNLEKVLQIFEEKSRNYTGIDFSKAPTGAKKILITGFDPFQLNDNIKQSNPSGCVALNLFDTLTENQLGYIQSMIVPVRYKDFDGSSNSTSGQGEGIIEKYIKPWINKVDMIITISQALPDQYHIDVFATATRGGFEDNMNYSRIKNSKSVSDTSPETIVTTLPENFTVSPSQAIFYGKYFETIKDEEDFYVLNDNSKQKDSTKGNYPSVKVYSGPGGNYLSNEIFYRVAKIRSEMKPTLATGHFHVAKLQDETSSEDFSIPKTQNLLDKIKTAIDKGVTGL